MSLFGGVPSICIDTKVGEIWQTSTVQSAVYLDYVTLQLSEKTTV